MENNDIIDLVAVYQVKPPVATVGFAQAQFYNRIRTRAWTGYDNANCGGSANGEEEIVYITPEGTVYHKSRSCTYLKLSISAVDMDFLEEMRNKSGAIYYSCESCGSHCQNTVYITQYGTRYHATLQCSKLKRTILAVPISEAGGRGGCSKCAG